MPEGVQETTSASRVAVVQAAAVGFDLAGGLEKLDNRTPEGRDHFRRYWEASVDVPGPALDRLAQVAADNALFLVVTVVERDGGTQYCTALFFSPDGYLGKHRKLMPTAADQFTRRRDFPDDLPNELADGPDDVVATGGSCIIGPLGQVLAGPARDGDEILFADLDLGDIARGTFDFDVVGHYARPDVFRLTVDEQPKPPVVTLAPRDES